jgi:hypothetical protein
MCLVQAKQYSVDCVKIEPIFKFTAVCKFWELLLEESRRKKVTNLDTG